MAEGARLESVYTGNRIVGSNPTPSAKADSVGAAKKISTSSRFVRNLRLLTAFGVMAEKVSPRAGESASA